MAKNLLIDSGFWIGLSDSRDQHAQESRRLADRVSAHTLLVPWPTLYEVITTRFTRRGTRVKPVLRMLASPNVQRVPDDKYRDPAFEEVVALLGTRSLSLVDVVMRAMIRDERVKIDGVLTFNHADFDDVCRHRNIELVQL